MALGQGGSSWEAQARSGGGLDWDRSAEMEVVGGFPRDAGSQLGDGVEVAGEGGGRVKDMSWASYLYHEQNGDARDTGSSWKESGFGERK